MLARSFNRRALLRTADVQMITRALDFNRSPVFNDHDDDKYPGEGAHMKKIYMTGTPATVRGLRVTPAETWLTVYRRRPIQK